MLYHTVQCTSECMSYTSDFYLLALARQHATVATAVLSICICVLWAKLYTLHCFNFFQEIL